MSWPSASLEELCEINVGRTPARANPEFWGVGRPWLSIADMNQGRVITSTKEQITEKASVSGQEVKTGTVLLSFKLSIGKVAVAGMPLYTNEAIAALPIKRADRLLPEFLARALEAQDLTGGSNRAAMGATLNKAKLKQIQIPVPPIDDQRRIAAILDQVDALRAKRRQALAHLDDLRRTVFLDMFGDPAVNPAGFAQRSLGSLATVFRDGPFGSNLKSSHYVDSGVRVIRLQNIGIGRFVDKDRAYITPEHFASLNKHRCLPGDVLIATMGDPNLRACLQPESVEVALNKADCIQMRVDSTQAQADWVCALINMPGTLRLATSLVLGQTRSRISMGRLRGLEVPVPPLNLQREFSERANSVDAQHAAMKVALEAKDHLFASLQARAFRGGL
jgi:type I restriction enzyme S subunit